MVWEMYVLKVPLIVPQGKKQDGDKGENFCDVVTAKSYS